MFEFPFTPYNQNKLAPFAYQKRTYLSSQLIVNDRHWYAVVPKLNEWIYRIFQLIPSAATICLDNDQSVSLLNGQFRNKYRPTNVLTFETPEGIDGGDIILALQTVKREALASNKKTVHHLVHLIIHGLLHLQGYDHIEVNEARQMEMKEAQLLHKLGVPNPWKITKRSI